MNDDDIVMLRRGDPCPICGQPIRTDDEGALRALTLLREYLDIAEMAGAAIYHLKNNREPEREDDADDKDGL